VLPASWATAGEPDAVEGIGQARGRRSTTLTRWGAEAARDEADASTELVDALFG